MLWSHFCFREWSNVSTNSTQCDVVCKRKVPLIRIVVSKFKSEVLLNVWCINISRHNKPWLEQLMLINTAIHISNLCATCQWEISPMLWPLYPLGNGSVTECTIGWVGLRTVLEGKGYSGPTGIRPFYSPARSMSLYHLLNPGTVKHMNIQNCILYCSQ